GIMSGGSTVFAGGSAAVFNTFMLVPGPGFASPTAHITLDLLLDGILSASGSPGCGVPQCNTTARVDSWLLLPAAFQPDPGTPQPATVGLLALGLVGVGAAARRRYIRSFT